MINYNTESMHTAGKAIQDNGKELQSNLQTFWSNYQKDMTGTFTTFAATLTTFMNRCQDATRSLAQNRIDIGTKLDQAATAVDVAESRIRQQYRERMRSQ